jgi:hypothetical protein
LSPTENITPEKILQTPTGFMAAKFLFVARHQTVRNS